MTFYDTTDAMAGANSDFRFGPPRSKNGLVIQFYHIATVKESLLKGIDNGSQATFKAFLTSFKDSFKVNWNPKETFGRMDAIQTFKNTQRTINLSFEAPSNSEEEANLNFIQLQNLIKMQYPVYEMVTIGNTKNNTSPSTQNGATIDSAAEQQNKQAENTIFQGGKLTKRLMSSPPLLYVKFMNWIENSTETETDIDGFRDCLVGTISDVVFEPDLEQGVYLSQGALVPKLFTVSLNINIIHTQELGWVKNVSNSNQQLSTHNFGEPKGLEGQKGFKSFRIYPYNTQEKFYAGQDDGSGE